MSRRLADDARRGRGRPSPAAEQQQAVAGESLPDPVQRFGGHVLCAVCKRPKCKLSDAIVGSDTGAGSPDSPDCGPACYAYRWPPLPES